EVFSITPQSAKWTYTAVPSQMLLGTQLPIQPAMNQASRSVPKSLHDATWWADKTRQFTFVKEDLNDEDAYNRVLWEGTMGDKPSPVERSGLDLRHHRKKLLRQPAAKTDVIAQNASYDRR